MDAGRPGSLVPDDAWGEGDSGRLTLFQKRGSAVDIPRAGLPQIGDESGGEGDELKSTFFHYLRVVLKRKWLIAASILIVVTLGLIMTLLSTSMFTASTTLQIDRDVARVVDKKDDDLLPSSGDAEFYQTQYELLKSRSLAERVAAALSLTENPTVTGVKKPGLWTNLWTRVSLFFGRRTNAEPAPDLKARLRAATGFVSGGLAVEPVRLSRLVRLSFTSPNAQLSQQVVNAIAENYIAANLERRFDASSYARTFLQERLQQLKAKLEDSDQQLVKYAQKEQIVSFDDKATLVSSDLSAASGKLNQVRNDRIAKEQIWHQAESAGGLALPQFLDSDVIKKLRDTRAQLSTDYEQKRNLFKPAYPEMVDLRTRIQEIDNEIKAEVSNIKGSLKADYEASLHEETALAQQVETLKTAILDLRARSVQYNILQREADTNRSLYDGLLQRYKEIGVAGGVGTNNISIVDKAEVPTVRSSPSLRKNLTLALILGLAGGLMAAFGLEFLDDTLSVPEDIETKLGLTALGVIPKFGKGADGAALLKDPRSVVSEAYRSLGTALQFSTEEGVPKTILVTSARPSEGKSTTALTLARNFAQLGAKVLLIDADLRNPSLQKQLGIGGEAGLTNYLAGAARPPELIHQAEPANLAFMSSGPLPPNPAELLAGPRMMSLLTVGAQVYDIVVVDGPPVMGLADAPLLASMTAGTLIVAAAGETRLGMLKQAVKRLQFARARVLGALLTKFDAHKAGYTYGYGYGYGYGDENYGYGNDQPKELPTPARAEAAE